MRADLEARTLAGDSSTRTVAVAVLDQPVQLVHRLARHDHARHAFGARGQRQLGLRQPMAVGRHRAQRRLLAARGGVQIDAVQIVAGLLGGDGEARLVDQALQVRGGDREAVAETRRRRDRESPPAASVCSAKRELARSVMVSRPLLAVALQSRSRRRRAACARCRGACAPAR